jgi:hypothetical protein
MARKNDLNRREHRVAPTELPHDLLKEPVRRRAWLLEKALGAYPLDRALELARAAEDFITQSRTDPGDETSEPHIKTVAEGRRSGAINLRRTAGAGTTTARRGGNERGIGWSIRFVATAGSRNPDGFLC